MRKGTLILTSILIFMAAISGFSQNKPDQTTLEFLERLEYLGFQIQKVEKMVNEGNFSQQVKVEVSDFLKDKELGDMSTGGATVECYYDENEVIRKIKWNWDAGSMGGTAGWDAKEFYFSVAGKLLMIKHSMALRMTVYIFDNGTYSFTVLADEWDVEQWDYTNPQIAEDTYQLREEVKKLSQYGEILPGIAQLLLGRDTN